MDQQNELRIKVFGDGADVATMVELATNPLIRGFTTNPTLMRKAGVTDYVMFAKTVLASISHLPVCFEVFSDDLEEMARQAELIAGWGENVYVKVPVTNTAGVSTKPILRSLTLGGTKLNVTAILSVRQVEEVAEALADSDGAIVSVFAGRIADTGRDPIPLMEESLKAIASEPNLELLWASPREVLNIRQADQIGCHIITVTPDLLKKLEGFGTDLEDVSLATVRMFHDDARASGYVL